MPPHGARLLGVELEPEAFMLRVTSNDDVSMKT
jgi:hypothetical protein